jgi:hypothetical protein
MIGGLDNPGWELSVDLEGTYFEGKEFEELSVRRTEHNWIDCRIERFKFRGFCGPRNLNEMIQVFRDWVEQQRAASSR